MLVVDNQFVSGLAVHVSTGAGRNNKPRNLDHLHV